MPMNFFSAIRGFPFLIDYSGLKNPKQTNITEISLDLDDSVSLRTKVLENPGNSKKPVIYLQHGMSFKGIDDVRILALGNNLANRGFRVYLPELTEVKNLLIRSETISNIKAAFLKIHSLEKCPVSYLSASFSAGMGFVALANSECQKVLSSVLLIGSYSDFVKTLPYVLKNYEIESYAVNVMMYNYIHLIRSKPEGLKKYFLESSLDNGLSREGDDLKGPNVFLDLNEEDKNFLNRFLESATFRNQLALEIKSIVPETFAKETSPAFFTDHFYRPCFLLHGDDDPVISAQESKDLRELLLKNGNQNVSFLETGLLTHGDHRPFYSSLNEIFPMAIFWGEYLKSVFLDF
ncbi:alpha/beta hydrolase [Leptospira noguchii]|uniref:alpha/beta hydrolase family protein n=1 Tax=Leptospira noguchii TaxID=28182 RepID=UPI001F0561CE|nr:alpha/beta hydrolase [Leptospira noguchii]MCH1913550.1 alpha/beta hydrolase [Leptospira noguchii]MCH1915167.1 alpha/beta hydrolase [Leptospira noguchii]UOG65044.1 alpha/beta hydrolase [Leptospira noguchii]